MSGQPSAAALAAAAPPGRIWRLGRRSLILHPRLIVVTVLLLAVALLLGLFAMTLGTLRIPLETVLDTVLGALLGQADSGRDARIVLNLRLPRVVTALFAGAALGVSGAIFQSVSRNALGSPDVIGFTTGAATGAISQIILFGAGPIHVAAGAILGGLLTAVIVYLLSLKGGVTGGYRLILIGIGVGAVLGALNNLLLVVGNLDDAIVANQWLSGSLQSRTWLHAAPVLVGVLVLVPIVSTLARRTSLMEMGDDLATQLGVRVERVRIALIFLAVFLAALATGAAGPIAFIALAAPQIVLRLTRSRSLPVVSAAAMGSALLIGADVLGQLLPITATVPIGRITGVIGGLYLLWLLTRSKQV